LSGGNNYLDVYWNSSSSPDVKEYKVFFGTAAGVYGTPVVGTGNSLRIPALEPCRTYHVAVKAVDFTGLESPLSTERSVTLYLDGAPAAPTGVTAEVTRDSATLSWQPNGECDLRQYKVYRSLTRGAGYDYVGQTPGTTFTNQGLAGFTTYYYIIKAEDSQGLLSAASQEVQIITADTVPPTQPVLQPSSPLFTSSTSFVLRGTKEADSSILIGGREVVSLNGSTTWEAEVSLTSGLNRFSVTSVDPYDNVCNPVTVDVYLDLQPPIIGFSDPAVNGRTNGINSISVTLSDSSTGAGVDLSASLAGAAVKDAAGSAVAGSWSVVGSQLIFTPAVGVVLVEGSYTVFLQPVDVLGNRGSVEFAIHLDTTPPAAQTFSMSQPSPHRAETISFTVTFSEGMKTSVQPTVTLVRDRFLIDAYLNLTGSWVNATTWRGQYAFTPQTGDGDYTVIVAGAKDIAGNVMAEKNLEGFVLDTVAPPSPVVGALPVLTRIATQSLSGSKAAETALLVNGVVKVPLGTATEWVFNYPLREGSNSLSFVARDAAGNDSLPVLRSVVLDTLPPAFTIDGYQARASEPTQTLSGTKEPGCRVTLNGVLLFDQADQSPTWTHSVTLEEGVVTRLTFVAADAIGNSISRPLDLVYDISPPPTLTGLSADGSGRGTEVRLGWPAYVEPADIAFYRVYVSGADFSDISLMTPVGTADAHVKAFTATGLTEGALYYFAVEPVDISGNSVPQVQTVQARPADTAPPEEVTALTATASYAAGTGNTVTLRWTASLDSRGDLAGQLLYIDGGAGYAPAIPLGKTVTTYAAQGLADGALHRFRIATRDLSGHESPGVVAQAVTRLPNPTGLVAEAGRNQAVLRWNAVASPYLKAYRVYRLASNQAQTSLGAMALVKELAGTSFTDTGLTNGQTYQYAVAAVNISDLENPVVLSSAATPRQDAAGPVISGPFIVSTVTGVADVTISQNHVVPRPIRIRASAIDADSAMDRIEITIDDAPAVCDVQSTTAVNCYWNTVAIADGNHQLVVAAFDEHGNRSEVSRSVVLSLAPPAVPVYGGFTETATEPQYLATLRGTADRFTTVALKVNGSVIAQKAAGDDGSFEFTSVRLVEGLNNVSFQASHRGGMSAFSGPHQVIVDTLAPPSPTTLSAQALAGGTVQLSWQAGVGELPVGYNLYSAEGPCVSVGAPGVQKHNAAPIIYLFKEILPAADGMRVYAVTALDAVGRESGLSEPVQVSSDRSAPTLQSVNFAAAGGTPSDSLTAGPSLVTVNLTLSEPLKEPPFFSLEPTTGSPIVVALSASDPLHYSGTYTVTATTPNGATVYKFSGRDLIGNRASRQGAGPVHDVRGPIATVTAPLVLQQTLAGTVAVSLSFDEAPVATPLVEVVDSAEASSAVVNLTAGADRLTWSGSVNLSGAAEGEGTFRLIEALDLFGNLGRTVASGATIYLYRDVPPAPAAPQGLTASSEKGGRIALTWAAGGEQVASYRLYRKMTGETAMTLVATVTARSGVDTPPADGTYVYSVSAVGPLGTEGPRSAEVEGGSDRTPPSPPTGLTLALNGNGTMASWAAVTGPGDGSVELPATYRLYREGSPVSTVSGLTPVAVTAASPAFDPAATKAKPFYVLTALDALGNESAPCAAVELPITVAPVSRLVLSRIENGSPTLDWQTSDSNHLGFFVYRNGSRINTAPTPAATYADGLYASGPVTYGVSVAAAASSVDPSQGVVESPIREVTLPQLSIGVRPGTVLRRGLVETVPLVLSAPTDIEVAELRLKVGSSAETLRKGPFSLKGGEELVVSKEAATGLDALTSVPVVATAVLKPASGTEVVLTRTTVAQVTGAGAALEIFNEPLVRGTTAQVRLKVNNLGSAPLEFLTSEKGGPTAQVKVYLRDQDGNLLAQGALSQRTGSQVVNGNGYASARLPVGASFLSEPLTFAVPQSAPAAVVLEAVIVNTYYHYGWEDQVAAPGYRRSVQAGIAEVSYLAVAQADKGVYHQGEPVLISGQALASIGGEPMAHVPVKVVVSVRGFDRVFSLESDENGNFSHTFTPAAGEYGTYSFWAAHPDLNDRSVQGSFDISGLRVTPSIYNLTLVKGEKFNVPITLQNLGGSEIIGLAFGTETSTGLTATVVNGGDTKLTGGETQSISLKVESAADTAATGYARLTVTTASGLTGSVNVNVNLVTAIPIIRTDRSYIKTGLMWGTQKIESFTLSNTGQATLTQARLEGPSIPWLSLTTSPEIGDVKVGQSVPVGIMIRPDSTIPSGVYDDRIVITSGNHIPYTFNIQVTVTSDAVGSVYFDVQNELWDETTGGYEKVAGAAIVAQHQSLLELRYNLKTGSNGTVSLNDIPEGRYSFNVSAPGHLPYSGSFVVEPGVPRTVAVALEVNMVDIEWSVVPTVIEDKYEIKITQTFETNVPTPVLIAEPAGLTLPEMAPGEVLNGEFKVTNYGLIAVFDVEFAFPTSFEDYDMEVFTEVIPDRIEAMQSIRIPYRVTRRLTPLSAGTDLYSEVSGFGGGDCVSYISVAISGKCVICPNSPAERVITKAVNWFLSFFKGCPSGTGGGTIIGGGGGGGGGWGSSGQSGGGASPGQPTPIVMGDPCECMNCDDGNACTEDSCVDGACVNKPKDCDDGDPCTLDACVDGACSSEPKNCDDGDPCTVDSCVGGTCVNEPKDCDDGDPCTVDSCENGECVHILMDCDDGNPCTVDSCSSGVCTNIDTSQVDPCTQCVNGESQSKNCDDDDGCTLDVCLNGICINTPISEADPCFECVDSQKTPKNCDDGDPCTFDSCENGVCVNIPIEQEDPCVECINGQPQPRNCDDGDPCTIDECENGECVNTPINEANPCQECVSGAVQNRPNETIIADEGNSTCSIDRCNNGEPGHVVVEALQAHNPDPYPLNIAQMTNDTQVALTCLQQRVNAVGGTIVVTSAFRPQSYQDHLREVWDKYMQLRNWTESECTTIRNQVVTEFIMHGLLVTQRPADSSSHSTGTAFDAVVDLPNGQNVDTLAGECNLVRPVPVTDPVHFRR
jgi:fibronectin type 3 domain-containing protein